MHAFAYKSKDKCYVANNIPKNSCSNEFKRQIYITVWEIKSNQ